MDIPKTKEVKPIFYCKNGMPRKDILLNAFEVATRAGYTIPTKAIEKQYFMQRMYLVLYAIKKQAIEHNILFITPKLGRFVYYGFSKDIDKIENSGNRVEAHKNNHLRRSKQYRQLTAQVTQLLLPGYNKSA